MSSLVVFFSQTGNTKFVAEKIAEATGADVEEIREIEERSLKGMDYMRAGRDGMMKKKSKIQKAEKDPGDYDTIFVGSPVWGFNLCPAIRSYLSENQIQGKKIALFCTFDGMGDKKLYSSIRELTSDCEVVGELSVMEKELKDKEKAKSKVSNWVAEVQG
ncbi:flavodoxin family protein [Candidatus Altiarchaeota archaeon]